MSAQRSTAGTIGPSFGYGVTVPWANLGAPRSGRRTPNSPGPRPGAPAPRVLIGSTDAFNRNATLLTTRGKTASTSRPITPYGPLVGHST